MAIYYRKVQNTNELSDYFGKWYGRAVILNAVNTKQLAEEISHATTVTYSDVLAVLAETAVVLKNHLQNSHKVVLDGIGTFKVGISTKPADSSANFNSSKIIGYHIVYTPEKTFTPKGINEKGNRTGFYVTQLLSGITAKEAPTGNSQGGEPDKVNSGE
jgi:predicted histone-like DNA-binding protein